MHIPTFPAEVTVIPDVAEEFVVNCNAEFSVHIPIVGVEVNENESSGAVPFPARNAVPEDVIVPPTVRFPDMLAVPATSKLCGVVLVPIPTLPKTASPLVGVT